MAVDSHAVSPPASRVHPAARALLGAAGLGHAIVVAMAPHDGAILHPIPVKEIKMNRNTRTLGLTTLVLALTTALFYFVNDAVQASNEIDRIKICAAFAGNDLPRQQIKDLVHTFGPSGAKLLLCGQ